MGAIHLAVMAAITVSATAQSQSTAQRPFHWGKTSRGLTIGIRTDRDAYMRGEKIVVECAIKNTGRSIHRFTLPALEKSTTRFTDFFLLIEGKQPVQFSARLVEGGDKDRQVKISPGDEIILRKIELNLILAFPYEENLRLLHGYPTKLDGRKRVAIPSLGPFGTALQPGEFLIGWLVYDRARRTLRPTSLKSKATAFKIKAKPWHAMTPAERDEYLASLKKKLFYDAWSAKQASEALAPLGKRAVPILIEGMKSKKYATRAWSVATAASIDDPRLVDPLVHVIKTDKAMGQFFYHMWKQRSPKILAALVDFLQHTPNGEAKSWVLRGLKENARALPADQVKKLLADPNPPVRSATLVYAARRQKARSSALLRGVLANDKSEEVRGLAAELLGEFGGKSLDNYKALVHVLANDTSDYVRQMACAAMTKLTGNQWVYQVGDHVPDSERQGVIRKWRQWLTKQTQ
jgi:HEAT repeat protein